jgi:hypothetical protein
MPELIVFGNPARRRRKTNPQHAPMPGLISSSVYQVKTRGSPVVTRDFAHRTCAAHARRNGTVELRQSRFPFVPRNGAASVFFRTLDGRELARIRYRHAEDGADYQHPFAPGAFLRVVANGWTAVIYRRDGRPVWGEFSNHR